MAERAPTPDVTETEIEKYLRLGRIRDLARLIEDASALDTVESRTKCRAYALEVLALLRDVE